MSSHHTLPLPPPPVLYSSEYFNRLLYQDIPSLHMPLTLPDSSLIHHVWEYKAAPTSSENLVTFDEHIPSMSDIQALLGDIQMAERNGFTVVTVNLRTASGQEVKSYSVSKIRIMACIHNQAESIKSASWLFQAVQPESGVLNCPGTAEFFQDCRIFDPLPGYSSAVPAWTLSCLTMDVDIHYWVIDLAMENLYLRIRTSATAGLHPIVLPPLFSIILLHQYSQPFPRLSNQLSTLSHFICNFVMLENFSGLSFLHCNGAHYSTYHYSGNSRLLYGNSLTSAPTAEAQQMVSALNWLLPGTGLPPIIEVSMMDVAFQGGGSCSGGIAALNALEKLYSLPGIAWHPNNALALRYMLMERLLCHAMTV
ncbi:hypothetical protein M407DRAFT_31060 [Tulasnella calospora MUT 4182]|uniref:Uncharacterized protein n=1 Tax=Tulasnella calospora MUT 4182 TaxID=1051891 RepID=A0A0C3LCS3_9AGAM|nr:hypothetical protein M407DRAFT_31060 [Tulasnella calospora MUT 4182]